MRTRNAGFTILELLVTLLVGTVAVIVAGHLLALAQGRVQVEMRRALDPLVPLALEQIRADARGAVAAADASGALVLVQASGPPVVYQRDGDRLLRTLQGKPGSRELLRGVRSFSFTVTPSLPPFESPPEIKSLLAVVFEVETTASPGPLVEEGRRVVARRRVETHTVVVALRGDGGVGW